MNRRVYVAGLPVVPLGIEDALDRIWNDARSRTGRVYALVNAYSAKLALDDAEYAAALADDAVIGLPDGVSVSWGASLVGVGPLSRCAGPDLMEAACERAAVDGLSFYFLGGLPGVVDSLCAVLAERFHAMRIAGVDSPPLDDWSSQDSARIVSDVRASGADVLWLGVSAPKQEKWAVRHLSDLHIPVVCVGAAFDFLSGTKPRAPLWMQSVGLEWFYRLVTEPRRLWRRYLVGNSVFLRELVLRRESARSNQNVDCSRESDRRTTDKR